MLTELAVRDLGVITELTLLLGPGMTALTGETGAGKTLVVGAIDLLCGGRADATLVRAGAAAAEVSGRFVVGDDEIVVRRVVPRDGRSRAYVDGQLATVASLAEVGARLVDLHGQHAHQSLLRGPAQRGALDRFGDVDVGPLVDVRRRREAVLSELDALGGDARARARELDLLRFQLDEIEAAGLDADDDAALDLEEDRLADAVAHREAAVEAVELVVGDEGAVDRVGQAASRLAERTPFTDASTRLLGLQAELDEVAREVRTGGEAIEEDPARLAEVRQRRQLIRDLQRKYGDTVEEVLEFAVATRERIAEIESHEVRVAALEEERSALDSEIARLSHAVGEARRDAAPSLAREVESHLAELALAGATLDVRVGDDPGDDVTFAIAANPGTAPLPLAKVASGGELARVMLALRLVLTAGPPTLVFDEVDAGIGGATALAVGRALGVLGRDHQVLVVTHLPQVAAFADHQLGVTKSTRRNRTHTEVAPLDEAGRVVELSRMLSGSPDSDAAHEHAVELLARAATERATARR
jgi:DNA repair protein RecN (Recombination protein N)